MESGFVASGTAHVARTSSCQFGNFGVVHQRRPPARPSSPTAPVVDMKALYPSSHEIPNLSEAALSLKIARHSPCSICTSELCPGLRPPPIFQLVLDSEEDYDGSESYLSSCQCGHDVTEHGADLSVIDKGEFDRRGRVAVRLDELLQVWKVFVHCT